MSKIVKLYDSIYKHYRIINSIITFGLDRYWRKKAVCFISKLNSNPKNICDICSGTGDFTEVLVDNFNASNIIGVDANVRMIELAKLRKINAQFINAYISKLPFNNEIFDVVTISFATRNIFFSPDFSKSISEIKRVLKKGGFFVSLETTMYSNILFSVLMKFYIWLVIGIINIFLSNSHKSYSFLKSSIYSFKVEKFVEIIKKDFVSVYIKKIFPGSIAICIAKK